MQRWLSYDYYSPARSGKIVIIIKRLVCSLALLGASFFFIFYFQRPLPASLLHAVCVSCLLNENEEIIKQDTHEHRQAEAGSQAGS